MPPEGFRKRKRYLIDDQFQYTFILKFIGIVSASILLSFLSIVTYYYVRYSRGDLAMKFYYVTGQSGTGIQETTLLSLVIPALGVSAVLCLLFSAVFGLIYSHRIAGPLYNLRRVIGNIRRGKLDQVVRFRKKDEFHDLASEMNTTISWLRKRIARR